jgi:hypothetical protein
MTRVVYSWRSSFNNNHSGNALNVAIKLIMVCVLAFVLHEEHLQSQHHDHERKQHYLKHYVSVYNIINRILFFLFF